MALTYKTQDYFRDFQCLGGDCPDTCCQRWEIKLDRRHYELLQARMSEDTRQSTLFETYIRINDKPVLGDYDYAHINMADNGYCPMLSDDGLCDIHRAHGVEPLGNICTFFPRVIVRRGNDVEMSGALSCPEVVRRCLSQQALPSLVRFSPADLPRAEYPITRELPRGESDHYAGYFSKVRDSFLSIMAREEKPLAVRLYALASVANRLSRFYHRGCEAFEASLLEKELQRAESEEAFVYWSDYLDQYQSDEPMALIVIQSILQLKQEQFPQEKTSQLAKRIFGAWADEETQRNWTELFAEREQQVEQTLSMLLDRYITRYLYNCLFREWFYTMPDSFTYIQMLLVRTAMLRFLLIADPEVARLLEAYSRGELNETQLEQHFFELAVNTTYRFCRDVDQNLPFLQVLYNALGEQQMMNFDYSLPFIKF
ncbi:flagellin lysine-N-methylase [Thiohalophilus sp.]|uniref:flagellin lysine-N-methylase n=1 Tax=Thiohalophilus sp. TaxID=3028392 RepID=UPI002ACDE9A9|nr:flagellin lysine-N-methylase [Thiohalophilus sp.]MDZ7804073.1 flagellin lysine-N-methylase [Thiohalophilus sp.]